MTTPTIELRPRLSTEKWNAGQPVRGDREIWINGAHWLNAIMSQHGVHGARHTIQYYDGGELVEDATAKHPSAVVISSRKYRQRRTNQAVDAYKAVPDQWTAITDKVRKLFDAGKLESPTDRKARREEGTRRYREQRDAEAAERSRMLAGYYSLRDRTDLTREQRDALAYVYKEAFTNPLPFPEGKP